MDAFDLARIDAERLQVRIVYLAFIRVHAPCAVLYVLAALVRARFGGPTPASARLALLDELLRVLRRYGSLSPGPGQTPLEFAVSASQMLGQNSAAREVAHVPERVIAAYYQMRYGGNDLDAAQLGEITHSIATLRECLRSA